MLPRVLQALVETTAPNYQFCLSIWLIYHKLSHTGGLLGMSSMGRRPLMFYLFFVVQ